MDKDKNTDDIVDKMVALLDEMMASPLGAALAHIGNSEIRQKKFEEIMMQTLGPSWEDRLTYDFSEIEPGGTYRRMDLGRQPYGECRLPESALEQLDRAGLLKIGLTPGQVQEAAKHVNQVYAAGMEAGRWQAARFATMKEEDHGKLFAWPPILETAKMFDVEEQFSWQGMDGPVWLEGFRWGIYKQLRQL